MMDIAIIATDLALYFKLVFLLILRIKMIREFPASPVVKTWGFYCHGPRFGP